MSGKILPDWKRIHTIVFDFDGVFTDNKVFVDENGVEAVCCDRGDGLGLDLLRAFIEAKSWDLKYYILSREKNPVVMARAQKMQIACVQSISNKAHFLSTQLIENNQTSDGLVYLGNDLNDLAAIRFAGFSVAPIDSHPLILAEADLVLSKKGGNGFVREFTELLIGLAEMSPDEVVKLV